MSDFAVGSLVSARGREWVVLPHSDAELLMLRPLGGGDDETTGVYLPLEGEDVRPARFDPPDPRHAGDAHTAGLLRDALMLGFRSSAGPFRSFGRIAVEPRPYQLVPLLMALRLDPVRLLIADDVGVGKTIEAGLIAREMLDSGDAQRLAVLCPPHLAEQWQAELRDKFHLHAELVLSSTAPRLERGLGVGESLFDRHPRVIVSTDFIKAERRRGDFLRTCPDLVIVDEAHTCAASTGSRTRQQRHDLLRGLARDGSRHLILVTATPHSGNEEAFRSLLGLLDPELQELPADLAGPRNERHRRRVAQHLVQRRRADIRHFADADTPFPERLEGEESYTLSPQYKRLFDRVLDYARESTRDTEGGRHRQRVRWWSALALLRSLGSSPAAAAATLRTRSAAAETTTDEEADLIGRRTVLDLSEDEGAEGIDAVAGADADVSDDDAARSRKRLRALAAEADALRGKPDRKLTRGIELVRELVEGGSRPIVFCRFIPTAEYVADALRTRLRGIAVEAVTGQLPPAEREQRVLALTGSERRVLVATDCLSEGVNLQDHFDAVVHYDLSWNPTRHEQRDGRVDRYGQPRAQVRTLTYFGSDNSIDGIVLDVLLRKHAAIRNSLGVSVPVPAESDAVVEAIIEGLILREGSADPTALTLFDADVVAPRRRAFDTAWQSAADREKRSRTMFAQEGIRTEEVAREAQAMRAAVGGGVEIERFLAAAVPALGGTVHMNGAVHIDLSEAPRDLRDRLPTVQVVGRTRPSDLDEAEPLTRTHPLVAALASHVADTALDELTQSVAARCGVIMTDALDHLTTALLVRFRYHVTTTRRGAEHQSLAEECRLLAFERMPARAVWLDEGVGEELLNLRAVDNIEPKDARLVLTRIIDGIPEIEDALAERAAGRAESLREAHRRVRHGRGAPTQVRPELPLDILGVYTYRPVRA